MKRLSLLIAIALTACSIELTQTNAPPQTPQPVSGDVTQPAATQPATEPPVAPLPAPAASGLDLAGRLIVSLGRPGIAELDFATGESHIIYTPPPQALVISSDVTGQSPIMLAYAPPPPPNGVQFGRSDLYELPAEGGEEAQPFLLAEVEGETLFSPAWSPDGSTVYYGRSTPVADNPGQTTVTLERIAYPSGQPEVLLENAFWPAISPDNASIAYVLRQPDTGLESLYIADADGSNPRMLVPDDIFGAIDATIFAPDGDYVIFSALPPRGTSQGYPHWLVLLTGAGVVYAHDLPSDWWRVPVVGGEPERLTDVLGISMLAATSPDGGYVAFSSLDNVQVMRPDGADLQILLPRSGLSIVGWVP